MGIAQRHFYAFAFCCIVAVPASLFAQSIDIQPSQTLTFPTLATVTSGGSVNLSVSPLNSSTSGTAQIVKGMASRGQYAVSISSGGTPVSISLDISGVSTDSGLTLDNFSGFYQGQQISFPSPTLPLPATSPASTPLYVGAKLTADSTVASGSHNASFTITVFVQ
jgi:hypothetical protein